MTDTSPHLRVTESTGILAVLWELVRAFVAGLLGCVEGVLDDLDTLRSKWAG